MSLFGRLKTAIKGNPVLKEHDLGKHVASAGPGLLWKVYDGVKKSTQQEVSIFVFNKHTPEIDKLSKAHKEELFEMLKKGPTILAKLRHPKILTLHHTVEESSDCIAFTTEPVFSCLANILGYYDNLPSPLPLPIKEYQLHSLEAHYGLLQIAESIEFLHNDVKMIHGNINPENILISRDGDWKLAGFNFATYSNYQTSDQTTFKFKEFNTKTSSYSTNPHLDYLAPEYIISSLCDTRSDLYSYGMLTFSVYNGGKPLYQNSNNTRALKHNVEQISRITESSLGDTPILLRSLVRELLAIAPSVRPDGLQIIKHVYFDDVLVTTLKYLDSLYSKSDMEKSQWFKTVLGRMVIKLPKRVVHKKVLPQLVAEFRNHKMIPFVLPLILLIADDCTSQEYSTLILPALIPVFSIHDPIQIPLIILQKMDLILKKTSPDEMKQYILPMIIATLDSDNNQVQELCVSVLPTFADMIDYTSMKHYIIPKLTTSCVQSSTVSLSIKCLVAMGQIVELLDKDIVLQQILPIIVTVPFREAGVLMAILGIFHKSMVSKNVGFDKELIATKILPYLIPLSIQPTLNKNQYNQFMVLIKELLKKLENDHTIYLEQLAKMEEQTRSTVEFARDVSNYKAIEDVLKGIETMSGVTKQDNIINTRVGSNNREYMKPTTQKNTTTIDNDMFAGLTVSQTSSNSPKTTPTISNMRKINFRSNNQSASNTPQMKQQSLGTWDVPSTSSIDSMGEATPASTGSHTRTRIGNRSPVMETGLLQPNHGWSSGILTESTSGIGMKPLDSGSGQTTEWSSSSINKPTPGLGMEPLDTRTGLLQPLTTSDWSNTAMPNSSKQLPSKPYNGWSNNNEQQGMGGILQPSSGWSNNQPSQGMGILQPSSGNINQSPSMGMGNIQPQSIGIGNTQPQGMGIENTQSSSMGTGRLQPTAVSGWSTESGSNFGTGPSGWSQHPAGGWSNSINQSSNISGMGTSQPQSMGMGTSQPQSMGMGTSQPAQYMGMGTSQPQGMGTSQPQGMGTSQSQNMGGMGTRQTSQPQNMGMGTGQPWSMGMGTSQSSSMGMGTSQPQGMGTAQSQSVGMGAAQPWSMGMGTAQSQGIGTNQSQSRGNNQQFGMTASDWSSNIGGWSNNTTSQLLPTGHSPATRPQTTPLYKDQSQLGIAPGPNPFADFNSLI